jgi:hypothetical protein
VNLLYITDDAEPSPVSLQLSHSHDGNKRRQETHLSPLLNAKLACSLLVASTKIATPAELGLLQVSCSQNQTHPDVPPSRIRTTRPWSKSMGQFGECSVVLAQSVLGSTSNRVSDDRGYARLGTRHSGNANPEHQRRSIWESGLGNSWISISFNSHSRTVSFNSHNRTAAVWVGCCYIPTMTETKQPSLQTKANKWWSMPLSPEQLRRHALAYEKATQARFATPDALAPTVQRAVSPCNSFAERCWHLNQLIAQRQLRVHHVGDNKEALRYIQMEADHNRKELYQEQCRQLKSRSEQPRRVWPVPVQIPARL